MSVSTLSVIYVTLSVLCTCDKITPFWQEVCNLVPRGLNFPIMLSAKLRLSGQPGDTSVPTDLGKTSLTVMEIFKRTSFPHLKGQDPSSLSKLKQEKKKSLGKKITHSRNYNLDQTYLFGTNSCHQTWVPKPMLPRSKLNVFCWAYIYFRSLLPTTSYFLFLTCLSALSKSSYTWLINTAIIIHRENLMIFSYYANYTGHVDFFSIVSINHISYHSKY